jgi:hypothetical protein
LDGSDRARVYGGSEEGATGAKEMISFMDAVLSFLILHKYK